MPNKYHIPHLEDTLGICMEAVGFRTHRELRDICAEAFCVSEASQITHRLTGRTRVASAELSLLAQLLGLDSEGIAPHDLTLPPEELRAKFIERGIGMFGTAICTQFLRAVHEFVGAPADINIRPVVRRGPGFTTDPTPDNHPVEYVLTINSYLRFDCQGPKNCALILLDHRSDDTDTWLLAPAEIGVATPGYEGRFQVPHEDDWPLRVRFVQGQRHATALWAKPDFVSAFDRAAVEAPMVSEYRKITRNALAVLTDALIARDNAILAAATLNYRSQETQEEIRAPANVTET